MSDLIERVDLEIATLRSRLAKLEAIRPNLAAALGADAIAGETKPVTKPLVHVGEKCKPSGKGDKAHAAILKRLEDAGEEGVPPAELVKLTGLDKQSFARTVKVMIDHDEIKRTGHARATRYFKA